MSYWQRLRRALGLTAHRPRSYEEPLSHAQFNAAAGLAFGPPLAARGFTRIGSRAWARHRPDAICELFDLEPLKGASYTPRWGFSLDFVPHLDKDGEIRWHRTLKSARFDLCCREIDHEASRAKRERWYMTRLATQEELERDLARVVGMAIPAAVQFWETVRSLSDLPTAFDARRARPVHGIPFENHPQEFLAHAFVLARCADPRGRAVLAEFGKRFGTPPEAMAKLERLLAEAASPPTR